MLKYPPIVRTPRVMWLISSAICCAFSSARTMSWIAGSICLPLPVRATPAFSRTNRGKPSSSSSERIMRVIPDWV